MPKKTKRKAPHEDCLKIENLKEVTKRVKDEMEEKKRNPSVVLEDEAGFVFIEGEPNMVIDDKYVPLEEAEPILQARKVVREWLKLQEMLKIKKK